MLLRDGITKKAHDWKVAKSITNEKKLESLEDQKTNKIVSKMEEITKNKANNEKKQILENCKKIQEYERKYNTFSAHKKLGI